MRPRRLDEFMGQEHLLGQGKPLRVQIERDQLASMILWGPPGVGKTTMARLIAKSGRGQFVPFSAVLSGIKEVKAVMADAERARRVGIRTVVFVDEIHRFNKAQQDAFLPYVERGDVILIGATTENPSFEVISALLSRCRVHILRALTADELVRILKTALRDKDRGLGDKQILFPMSCWNGWLSSRTGMPAPLSRRWKPLSLQPRPVRSPKGCSRMCSSARWSCTTSPVKSITT